MNYLYLGDCLNVLRHNIPDESVDLIYIDPPFNSKRPKLPKENFTFWKAQTKGKKTQQFKMGM